jgi:hypothetical protein
VHENPGVVAKVSVDLTEDVATSGAMELLRELAHMDAGQLRDLSATLFERLQQQEKQLAERDTQLSDREKQLVAMTKNRKAAASP